MADSSASATDGFILGLPGKKPPRDKRQAGKGYLKKAKLSSEPPGSMPLVEVYLGRMRWSDQAGYLRFIHTLGIDSQRLKKASQEPREQAIGFIAFSPARTFFRVPGSLGYKISGLDRISGESGFVIPRRIRHLWQDVVFKENSMSR